MRGPARTGTRTSQPSSAARWRVSHSWYPGSLRAAPGGGGSPTVNVSRSSPSRLTSSRCGVSNGLRVPLASRESWTRMPYTASSGNVKSKRVPPRVPNGSPSTRTSWVRSVTRRNVSAVADGAGRPTASRLIFLAADR